MTIESVAIDSITPDPANLRRHPDKNLATIKGSLTRFGQQKPIVCDSRGIILAGNGTYAAARELGWATINIVRTTLAGSDAAAFAIADNRTSETSEWDKDGLASVLAALRAEDDVLAMSTGFTLDEIAALLPADAIAGEPQQPQQPAGETPPDDFDEFGEDIDVQHTCPRCKFQWSGQSCSTEAA